MSNGIQKLLEIGATADILTPILTFLNDLRYGPPARFGVAYEGCSARDIERHLKSHGVRVWGMIPAGDWLALTVPEAQARWAYYLLNTAGVAVLYAPACLGKPAAKTKGRAPHVLESVARQLDKLYGKGP